MNEQIIEDPRATEIAQAFKDGDSVQMLDAEGLWGGVSLDYLPKCINKPMRIVKKPKIVLSKYGFDFTAEELPLSEIDDGKEYFFICKSGEPNSTNFVKNHWHDKERLKSRQAFSSPEAAKKWHAMTQAFYDDILKGVKHDL